MAPDFEYKRGCSDGEARQLARVVSFIRRHTRLNALADLLESGMHTKTPREVAEYIEKNNVKLVGYGQW